MAAPPHIAHNAVILWNSNSDVAMNQQLWQKVEQLFHTALERAPDARQRFINRACNDDTDLRRHVEVLVANDEQAGSFLEVRADEDMTVTPTGAGSLLGLQFGPYRIVSLLGAGGMGEVYRAHDSKLGRDVAIKTLPPEFARDSERLARFRREARTLASLNHPNIAVIYGLEEFGGFDFLVQELVEGETMRGPLPVVLAIDRARQVAEALEAAHVKRIVHRDLKPANVKVTLQGKVKVLDFGLAKAAWGPEGNRDLSETAAPRGAETLAGHILGTPGYMSPEQTRGQGVDERTDIWAFGCLLYELLTGKRAFQGESIQDTIAAVLEGEPDWQALPRKTPRRIRELLRQCLQKDTSRRLSFVADARRTIEQAQRGWSQWQATVIAATVFAVSAMGTALWLRNPSSPVSDRSDWIQLTKFPDPVSQPAFSSDGRKLAFVRGPRTTYGLGQVYIKELPDGEPVQLTHDNFKKDDPVFRPMALESPTPWWTRSLAGIPGLFRRPAGSRGSGYVASLA